MLLRSLWLGLAVWACVLSARAQDYGARAVGTRRISALTPEDATASGTSLDVEHRESAPRSLADVVREAPGARVTSTGGLGAPSAVSLRGADFDETWVLLDEIPLVGPDGGAFDLSLFPAGLFERVEVYRGGAPVWLGAGAIGGVLRLIPKRANETSARVSVGAGSFGTLELQGGAQVHGENGLGSRAQVIVRSTDGDFPYTDDGATRFDASDDRERKRSNAEFTDATGVLDVDVPVRVGELHFVGLALARTGGFPGPGSQPTPAIHSSSTRGLVGASFVREQKDAIGLLRRWQAVLSLSQSSNRYTDVYAQLGTSKPTASDDHALRLFARGALVQRVLPGVEGTLLATYALDRYDPFNRFAFPPMVPSDRHAAAVAAELRLHGALLDVPCELRPSARLEWSRTHIHAQEALEGPFDNTQDVVAPTARIAAVAEPLRGVALSASVATGTRLPTMFELFGDRGLTLASPDLTPVRSRSVDGGLVLSRQLGLVHAQGEVRGFVEERKASISAFRTAQYQVAHENLSRVKQWGVESGLGLRLGRYAELHGSFTWLDTENALGKRLPFRAKYTTYVRPEAHVDILSSVLSGAGAFGELSQRSFAFVDRANLAYVDACTKVSVGANIDLFGDRLRLSARMDDVGDARCSDLVGYPLPGRSLFFSLAFQEVSS